ncbi:MAG: hypothetical protein F4039_05425 [Gammaproteobacteria bacterium]|nr:hypothetical protein [Gammaproteobacteria bacterium]MYK43507.1 hypothetical protein [Gammaproteobacteria bacterium]
MKVQIYINGEAKLVDRGLISVDELYQIVGCEKNSLFLNREHDIDIPLCSGEHLIVRGDEQFVVGKSTLESNPPVRKPHQPEFNGQRTISLSKAKILGKDLKCRDETFPDGRLFVDIEGSVDVEISDEMLLVVKDTDSFFVIPKSEDEIVDTEECGKHDRRPPQVRKYRIRIDGQRCIVDTSELTGAAILALVGKEPNEWFLNQKLHGGRRERIAPDDVVDFSRKGIERFETVRKEAQQGNV